MVKKERQPYRPMSGGRASICRWDLEFFFFTKEQQQKFIKLLMDDEFDWNVSCWKVHKKENETDSFSRDFYYVRIEDAHWATGLIHLAKIIKKVDYESL